MTREEYVATYAEQAMEQMRRHGIPASITLAQGIIESSNGNSRLARNENNHFGIKATKSWLEKGGAYGIYTDDRPNEKFCAYATVADSYEHHSRFLLENKRYSRCFDLSADDYRGWAEGLQKAGYATSGTYAASLTSIIRRMGLDKYDKMVMDTSMVKNVKEREKKNEAPSTVPAVKAETADTTRVAATNTSSPTPSDAWLTSLYPSLADDEELDNDRAGILETLLSLAAIVTLTRHAGIDLGGKLSANYERNIAKIEHNITNDRSMNLS